MTVYLDTIVARIDGDIIEAIDDTGRAIIIWNQDQYDLRR